MRLSEKHPVGSVPLSSGHVLIRCLSLVFVEPKDEEGFDFPPTAWAGLLPVKDKGILKTTEGLPEFLEHMKLLENKFLPRLLKTHYAPLPREQGRMTVIVPWVVGGGRRLPDVVIEFPYFWKRGNKAQKREVRTPIPQ